MKKANMSNKLWSEDEDIYLKKYFSTTKNEFLAEKLNRTKDSIVVRANKLGLKKNKPPKWTEENIRLLKRLYENESIQTIAKTIGVGKDSVREKIKELGLVKHERVKFTPGGNKWLNILGIEN